MRRAFNETPEIRARRADVRFEPPEASLRVSAPQK